MGALHVFCEHSLFLNSVRVPLGRTTRSSGPRPRYRRGFVEGAAAPWCLPPRRWRRRHVKHSPSMTRFVALLLTGNHEQTESHASREDVDGRPSPAMTGCGLAARVRRQVGVEPTGNHEQTESRASREDVDGRPSPAMTGCGLASAGPPPAGVEPTGNHEQTGPRASREDVDGRPSPAMTSSGFVRPKPPPR